MIFFFRDIAIELSYDLQNILKLLFCIFKYFICVYLSNIYIVRKDLSSSRLFLKLKYIIELENVIPILTNINPFVVSPKFSSKRHLGLQILTIFMSNNFYFSYTILSEMMKC